MSLPYFFLSFILASLFQLVYLSKFKYLRNFFFFSCKLRKVERFYLNFLFCKMIEYSFSLYREASSSLVKHSVERTCSEILAYRCKSVLYWQVPLSEIQTAHFLKVSRTENLIFTMSQCHSFTSSHLGITTYHVYYLLLTIPFVLQDYDIYKHLLFIQPQ